MWGFKGWQTGAVSPYITAMINVESTLAHRPFPDPLEMGSKDLYWSEERKLCVFTLIFSGNLFNWGIYNWPHNSMYISIFHTRISLKSNLGAPLVYLLGEKCTTLPLPFSVCSYHFPFKNKIIPLLPQLSRCACPGFQISWLSYQLLLEMTVTNAQPPAIALDNSHRQASFHLHQNAFIATIHFLGRASRGRPGQ